MIRHIVIWRFGDGFSEKQCQENALKIKKGLESLSKIMDGVVELKVAMDVLPSSNANIVLNSLFEGEEALSAYQNHPEHKRIGSFIKSVLTNRTCIDYVE